MSDESGDACGCGTVKSVFAGMVAPNSTLPIVLGSGVRVLPYMLVQTLKEPASGPTLSEIHAKQAENMLEYNRTQIGGAPVPPPTFFPASPPTRSVTAEELEIFLGVRPSKEAKEREEAKKRLEGKERLEELAAETRRKEEKKRKKAAAAAARKKAVQAAKTKIKSKINTAYAPEFFVGGLFAYAGKLTVAAGDSTAALGLNKSAAILGGVALLFGACALCTTHKKAASAPKAVSSSSKKGTQGEPTSPAQRSEINRIVAARIKSKASSKEAPDLKKGESRDYLVSQSRKSENKDAAASGFNRDDNQKLLTRSPKSRSMGAFEPSAKKPENEGVVIFDFKRDAAQKAVPVSSARKVQKKAVEFFSSSLDACKRADPVSCAEDLCSRIAHSVTTSSARLKVASMGSASAVIGGSLALLVPLP